MAAHVAQERRQRQNARRPRFIADRENHLEVLPREEVFERLPVFPRNDTLHPEHHTRPECKDPAEHPLPPLLQLLVCLRYLATGCMHLLVGDSLRVSRSAAGRCIRQVSRHISGLAPTFINFPDRERAVRTKQEFAAIAGKQTAFIHQITSQISSFCWQ